MYRDLNSKKTWLSANNFLLKIGLLYNQSSMSQKNAIFVMLNHGRGSKEVVLAQIEAFQNSGYNIKLVTTQPYDEFAESTLKIDLGNLPIPIHDYLPGNIKTKTVYTMNIIEANKYRELFIFGLKKYY